MAAEAQPAGPFVAQLVGPAGLALEVFRQLLEGVGVVIVDPEDAEDMVEAVADVVLLIEPGPEHWAAVEGRHIPIVFVRGGQADGGEGVDSVLAGADAVLHCDSDPATRAGGDG